MNKVRNLRKEHVESYSSVSYCTQSSVYRVFNDLKTVDDPNTENILLIAGAFSRLLLLCFIFTAQPISQTTVYTPKEGDALDINCNAISTHNNEIYWEKNVSHSTFRQNGSHLNFVNITRDSAGGYVCYSKNLTAGPVNASIVRSIDIDVLCKFCICIIFLEDSTYVDQK